ncbi:hypothetical protein [Aquabacterium sp. NJ1]|uniref:hypothetical protein n=1 Tax=Aquabacterium sp. NJ1 TaxID=1538295 RepID=UPI00126A4C27|nr:hypothetical protein [Aquabacterium sp. NJ1]
MNTDTSPPGKSKSHTKVWLAVVGVAGSLIGIVPPVITALRSIPTVSQPGNGNTAMVGSTVNSNNQTQNTYVSMWVEGARTIFGAAPKSAQVAARSGVIPEPLEPPAAGVPQAKLEPEPGALGTIVVNASLMNDATWGPEPSRVGRLLNFRFHVEASEVADKVGTLDVTLSREGKDVCTISLNTKTSALARGVRWGNSDCLDTLAPNAVVAYRARVKAADMVPMAVRLDAVHAVRK